MVRNILSVSLLLALLAGPAWAEEELVWQNGQWVRQAPAREGTPEGELSLIRQDLRRKDFAAAVAQAEKFAERYPGNPLREDVLGLAGEAEIGRERYWQAYEWLEKQIAEFPSGARLERALEKEMEIAQAFLAGKKRLAAKVFWLPAQQEGIDILRKIAEHAPGTDRAEQALLAVGDYYFNTQQWEDAVDAYNAYLKLFPKSERAIVAELRSAESLLRSYRGPAWDDTPLIESQQRYRDFRTRHPAAAAEANVDKVLEVIHEARAQKQFVVAQFYARTGKTAPAAFYYRIVIEQFADTPFAGQAQMNLDALGIIPEQVPPGALARGVPAGALPTTRPTSLPSGSSKEQP